MKARRDSSPPETSIGLSLSERLLIVNPPPIVGVIPPILFDNKLLESFFVPEVMLCYYLCLQKSLIIKKSSYVKLTESIICGKPSFSSLMVEPELPNLRNSQFR
jgi:hypothetical protein